MSLKLPQKACQTLIAKILLLADMRICFVSMPPDSLTLDASQTTLRASYPSLCQRTETRSVSFQRRPVRPRQPGSFCCRITRIYFVSMVTLDAFQTSIWLSFADPWPYHGNMISVLPKKACQTLIAKFVLLADMRIHFVLIATLDAFQIYPDSGGRSMAKWRRDIQFPFEEEVFGSLIRRPSKESLVRP